MFSVLLPFAAAVLVALTDASENPTCKCFPGDACWPTGAEWASFNKTVGGKLIKTIPSARVCHNTFGEEKTYNEAACAEVTDEWQYTESFIETSYALNQPYFSNGSCDPFTGRQHACVVGTYVP